MPTEKELFTSIRRLMERIDTFRKEPNFTNELTHRRKLVVKTIATDEELLRHLAHIIAYAHADATRVKKMLQSGVYDSIWLDYDISRVAALNPCDVVENHWHQISPIMNGAKAFFIVKAARTIQRIGQFSEWLNSSGIPNKIQNEADLDTFWEAFSALRKKMQSHKIPYLGSVTSLSHLLLHLGYDCVKPDVIVMRVAKNLNFVDSTKNDTNLIKVARMMQKFSLENEVRPSEIDMYFLIQERQSEAKNWVTPNFTPVY
ncbi:hypothetical protein [Undibacterium sp.]|uniref:hypothetical protein n=1 Tax=Undibacterium sp. TaxID=1914977 RepID=UPI0037517617